MSKVLYIMIKLGVLLPLSQTKVDVTLGSGNSQLGNELQYHSSLSLIYNLNTTTPTLYVCPSSISLQ